MHVQQTITVLHLIMMMCIIHLKTHRRQKRLQQPREQQQQHLLLQKQEIMKMNSRMKTETSPPKPITMMKETHT